MDDWGYPHFLGGNLHCWRETKQEWLGLHRSGDFNPLPWAKTKPQKTISDGESMNRDNYPHSSSICCWDFPLYKASSYWESEIYMEPPYVNHWKGEKSTGLLRPRPVRRETDFSPHPWRYACGNDKIPSSGAIKSRILCGCDSLMDMLKSSQKKNMGSIGIQWV